MVKFPGDDVSSSSSPVKYTEVLLNHNHMQWECSAATDCGRRRPLNEDYFICDSNKGIFLVADGMGGENCGEVASQLTGEYFENTVLPFLTDEDATIPFDQIYEENIFEKTLHHAAAETNLAVIEYAESHQSHKGMGSTLTAAVFYDAELWVTHVGDSRLYAIQEDAINQITTDHTRVQEMVQKKVISAQEARKHPQKHIITQCVGRKSHFKPDIFSLELSVKNLYLICSDGLYDMVEDEEILAIVQHSDGFDKISQNLIRKANQYGGKDNITVVLFRMQTETINNNE